MIERKKINVRIYFYVINQKYSLCAERHVPWLFKLACVACVCKFTCLFILKTEVNKNLTCPFDRYNKNKHYSILIVI